jgi:hypothetical protein
VETGAVAITPLSDTRADRGAEGALELEAEAVPEFDVCVTIFDGAGVLRPLSGQLAPALRLTPEPMWATTSFSRLRKQEKG